MTTFHSFLTERLASGGFSTEDVLASFLPLVREVLDTHATGKVAPLEGLEALNVEGVRIWFEQAKRQPLRRNETELRRIEAANRAAVDVVAEARRLDDLDTHRTEVVNLAIGSPAEPITRPVYLPGYSSWEHALEHHDPLTDIFSLGMLLASLAIGLDFTDDGDLERFVSHRRNLFALHQDLHPVLARAVTRMTELDRDRRAQDLSALLHSLENYREQVVDLDYDLASLGDYARRDIRSKQFVVLTKLRERLFEITRRNRLLHFRATSHSVNLTQASVPLSFDIKNMRPDQILIWNDTLRDELLSGRPISLNKHLNFHEAIYLPSVLDRILSEARRDQAEFGFVQLRLVICFLHWANLKEQPPERFDSPLILVPVKLQKKKGIRDTYTLEALNGEAEINPVIRHQFKQLYDIDLPETLELANGGVDSFFAYLASKVESSGAGVPAVHASVLVHSVVSLLAWFVVGVRPPCPCGTRTGWNSIVAARGSPDVACGVISISITATIRPITIRSASSCFPLWSARQKRISVRSSRRSRACEVSLPLRPTPHRRKRNARSIPCRKGAKRIPSTGRLTCAA